MSVILNSCVRPSHLSPLTPDFFSSCSDLLLHGRNLLLLHYNDMFKPFNLLRDLIELALFERIERLHRSPCLECRYICLEIFVFCTKFLQSLLLLPQDLSWWQGKNPKLVLYYTVKAYTHLPQVVEEKHVTRLTHCITFFSKSLSIHFHITILSPKSFQVLFFVTFYMFHLLLPLRIEKKIIEGVLYRNAAAFGRKSDLAGITV